ncbi:MAG: extracellular solute-binding protein [Phycisphaerales bacterium]
MTVPRVLIALAFLLILGVPFALRPAVEKRAGGDDAPAIIIITPHVQQIRREFEAAFDRWHHARFGQHARIDWRTPGGTTEIIKQLEAQYTAAVREGRFDLSDPADPRCPPGTIGVDLAFGGGSFDHTRLKTGVTVTFPTPGAGEPRPVRIPMSEPAGFSQSQLDEWYGPNTVGSQPLYDPEQFWLGTALSSFGIVYNRDVLAKLGLPEPRRFDDLTDPRYRGWIALADPRQSGSVTTTFEAILNSYGWEKGWRILRDLCANTRYYTNSSTKPPIDISAGEAAAGLAIDFYGRSQAQSIARPGERPEGSRVGYIDPQTALYIDADPISLMRGGPNPQLARRFVEFCLSEESQALWQFPALLTNPDAGANTLAEGRRMGPATYELRRMPVRRIMYEKHLVHFVDKVNPFDMAREIPNHGWRSSIGVMMGCFAIDIADEQRAAWAALNRARGNPTFPPDRLAELERLFYGWPMHEMADGTRLLFGEATFKAIEKDTARWRDPARTPSARIAYTAFFRRSYEKVIQIEAAVRAESTRD